MQDYNKECPDEVSPDCQLFASGVSEDAAGRSVGAFPGNINLGGDTIQNG